MQDSLSSVCSHNKIVVGYWDKVGYKQKCDQNEIMIVLVVIAWQCDLAKTVSFWLILIFKSARAV